MKRKREIRGREEKEEMRVEREERVQPRKEKRCEGKEM